ncbi:hypothetical protein PG991_006890 [Apiospora marii]|uniref:Nuclear speckle splicing regulatory protein 1 N-terminal domain-containing protein n=1 Tax=Apiospora marii TaxID=335849 RepID=A0ABR1RYL1_9PEZI
MPQDPNLYGQRPAKRQKKEIPLSSSLAFTSQLTSLLSAPSAAAPTSSSSGRSRSSKKNDDLFNVKAKRKQTPDSDSKEAPTSGKAINLKDVRGTEEEKHDFARARRKMQEKARLYTAMKRGDYIAKEGETAPLVDFDAKWALKNPEDRDDDYPDVDSESSDSDSHDPADDEIIEYKDDFGRTRRGTRAEYERQQRREQRRALGAEELDRMSNVIYGDAIQSHAFNPEDATWDKMEELAAKRDREPTPPDDTHYDGNAEIRNKGVGFFHFSKDKESRQKEMDSLAAERETTERVRREREAEREKRKREIEERRRRIGAKRAEKLAGDFLDGLAGEMSTTTAPPTGDGSTAGAESTTE